MLRCRDEIPCVVQQIKHLHSTIYLIKYFDGTTHVMKPELHDYSHEDFYEHLEKVAEKYWFGRIYNASNLRVGRPGNCS